MGRENLLLIKFYTALKENARLSKYFKVFPCQLQKTGSNDLEYSSLIDAF